MKTVRYEYFLTEKDKLSVRFIKARGKIIVFKVNYSSYVNGKWRHIIRFDNAHESTPHKHVFHLYRKEYRVLLEKDPGDILTYAIEFITKDFQKIKENYIRVKPKKTL